MALRPLLRALSLARARPGARLPRPAGGGGQPPAPQQQQPRRAYGGHYVPNPGDYRTR